VTDAPAPAAPPAFGRVAIVGTGALGGSVAGALRARGLAGEIVGLDPVNARVALRAGLIDRVAEALADAVADADLVVLAAPVAANCAAVADPAMRGSLGPGAMVTDVSSTKSSIVAAALGGLGERRGRFVASHPIAGFDRAGPGASRADLFEGKAVLMCPTSASDPDVVARIEAMWTALGARLARMSPERHDLLFAEVSHWPHAVAFALSAAIGQGPLADDARRYHGAGLRDTTRVGGSPAGLWAGILLDNREPVLAAARAFRAELDRIESAIAAGDRDALADALARGERWRSTF
jgi:prephenate dehydrogenase